VCNNDFLHFLTNGEYTYVYFKCFHGFILLNFAVLGATEKMGLGSGSHGVYHQFPFHQFMVHCGCSLPIPFSPDPFFEKKITQS